MRPRRTELRVRRGLAEKLWQMSNEIAAISQTIRYANKPADLTWPIQQMIQITRRVDLFRDQWLISCLKSGIYGLDRWPKIWERYL